MKEEFKIIENRMNETVPHIIKDIALSSFKNCKTVFEVCVKIKNSVTQKYGGTWQCMAYKTSLGGCAVTPESKGYVYFSISDLNFTIFATSWKSLIIS